MLEQITDEIIGLGPLEPLLRDDSVSEIMVNGPRQVYIERSGKLELTNVVFQNDDHVMRIIDRIIEHFFTIKLTWSETNRFPHDLFWWEGLDGTRVLAHLFDNPDGGYNGVVGPRRRAARPGATTAAASSTRRACSRSATATAAAARPRRWSSAARELDGFPRAARPSASAASTTFFARAERSAADAELPVWVGEMYLELHRGTLTTQGRTKRAHRRAERDLVAAEVLGALTRAGRRASCRRRWSRSGACCCATSSTTSCPARASARSARRPRPSSAA